jgi:hypothetical protein
MTKETLNKIPKEIQGQLNTYKKLYAGLPDKRVETRARMAGYVQGLRDAGLITERERQILFTYMTV